MPRASGATVVTPAAREDEPLTTKATETFARARDGSATTNTAVVALPSDPVGNSQLRASTGAPSVRLNPGGVAGGAASTSRAATTPLPAGEVTSTWKPTPTGTCR